MEEKPRKRAKYVNCACLECKRRKIKCNGCTPCVRCDRMNLSCEYPEQMKRTAVARKKRRPDIFGIPYKEAIRLLTVYDSEVVSMYPIFSDGELIRWYDQQTEQVAQTGKLADTNDMRRCKLALAIGAGVSNTWTEKANQIYGEISAHVTARMLTIESDFDLLIMLILIHEYQFHTDQGHVAYKSLAIASTVAFELGFHDNQELEDRYVNTIEKEYYRQVFWCVYVLDRRLSIYTKRPIILNDDEITQSLSNLHESGMVESSENDMFRAMHLKYMVYFSQIATRVLKGGRDRATVQYNEDMLKKWLTSLPPELRPDASSEPPSSSRKLKAVLQVKSTLMMLQIYTAASGGASAGGDYNSQAVDAARDCIKELHRLYFHTNLYDSCQIQYNHFLVSALDVIYSASQQDVKYGQQCSNELDMALRLVNIILKKTNKHHGNIWQLISSFAVKLGYTSTTLSLMSPDLMPTPPLFDEMMDFDQWFKPSFQLLTNGGDGHPDQKLIDLTTSNTSDSDKVYTSLEDVFKIY